MTGYEMRLALVEKILTDKHARAAKGETITELAAAVLYAIDHISENVRR